MQRIKGFLVQVYDEGIRAANDQERRPRAFGKSGIARSARLNR
jgi:hypothetical protein